MNKKYGRLTLINKTNETKNKRTLYLFKCDCGNFKKVPLSYVTSGDTTSCGCLYKETRKGKFKHGLKQTHKKIYATWTGLRDRCNNSNNKYYNDYGGRGIKVCERWNNFINFLEDMGSPPDNVNRWSIDRINVNGDYEPLNCRWATDNEQANNRTNTKYIIYKNIKYTIRDFCKNFNLDYKLVYSRVFSGIRNPELLLINKKEPLSITYQEETLTIKDWCIKLNIKPNTFHSRVYKGFTNEETLLYYIKKDSKYMNQQGVQHSLYFKNFKN